MTVVAGPPVEIQVRVNMGVAAFTAIKRLNPMGSLMTGAPTVSEVMMHCC